MAPDNRKHRGPGPKDHVLFAPDQLPLLSAAAKDYCWLLDRDYTAKAALKLVGDHFKLHERQRKALDRCCQPKTLVNEINNRKIDDPEKLVKAPLVIDGFNLLIITEAALSGAPIFRGRDGLLRDVSGLHGSYRKIQETPKAITLAADFFKKYNTGPVQWIFDKPVSNSGRLAQLVSDTGKEQNINWETKLANQTDNRVAEANQIVISSDSQILARSIHWFNLIEYIVHNHIPDKWLIDIWEPSA